MLWCGEEVLPAAVLDDLSEQHLDSVRPRRRQAEMGRYFFGAGA
jgi:hypothetical protein